MKHNSKRIQPQVSLIGVICRGIQLLHVGRSQITVDGTDSTEKIIEMVQKSPSTQEIRLIFIDSPTMGGFNPPNPFEIVKQTQIPVVFLPDSTPKSHIAKVYSEIFPERREQIKFLQQLPPLENLTVKVNANPTITRTIYFHAIGTDRNALKELLDHLSEFSAIPEPLRLAHIIASETKFPSK